MVKEKWGEGPIKIGAKDRAGNEIKQFDFLFHEDEDFQSLGCVIYSNFAEEYVAMHEEGMWIPFELLSETIRVDDLIATRILGWSKIEIQGKTFWDMGGLFDLQTDKRIPYEEFKPMHDDKWMETVLYMINEGHPLKWEKINGYWVVYYTNQPNNSTSDESFGVAALKMLMRIIGYDLN